MGLHAIVSIIYDYIALFISIMQLINMFHHVVRYALTFTLLDHYFFQLTGIVRIGLLCVFRNVFKFFKRIPLFLCQFDFHIVDRFCQMG